MAGCGIYKTFKRPFTLTLTNDYLCETDGRPCCMLHATGEVKSSILPNPAETDMGKHSSTFPVVWCRLCLDENPRLARVFILNQIMTFPEP